MSTPSTPIGADMSSLTEKQERALGALHRKNLVGKGEGHRLETMRQLARKGLAHVTVERITVLPHGIGDNRGVAFHTDWVARPASEKHPAGVHEESGRMHRGV